LDELVRAAPAEEEAVIDSGCSREEEFAEDEGTAAWEEKLRSVLRGAGSRGLVLLRLRWCLLVVM